MVGMRPEVLERYGAEVSEGPIARARAALSSGDVLIAYDEAITALEEEPDNLDAHFLAALALARAGASERAGAAARDLLARIGSRGDVPIALRADAEALIARLAKDAALAAAGDERRGRLLGAAELYEGVAAKFGGYYSCINASTLRLLAGDVERARELDRQAQLLVAADRGANPAGDYWREATAAEAALVLGDVDAAQDEVRRAAAVGSEDFAALAVTRRQLLLVCDAGGVDCSVLDDLAPPTIIHYCGHRIDDTQGSSRFPASAEGDIARRVRAYLAERRVGFGYGSLASGLRKVSTGTWFIKHGPTFGDQITYNWAAGTNYEPITGDFNGDGKWDIGLRKVSTGTWFIKHGPSFGDQITYNWGPGAGAGLEPVTGDFNGDHKSDIGLRRISTGTWYIKHGTSFSDQITYPWAATTNFQRITGDFNADHRWDIGLRKVSTGTWFIKHGPTFGDQITYNWAAG